MKTLTKNIPLILFLILVTALIAQTPGASSPGADQTRQAEQLKARGPDTPLTVLPVILAGRPADRVTEFVALWLEKQGLNNIELGPKPFLPSAEIAMEQLPEAVAAFVRQNPPATDYVLFTDFKGTQQSGLNELRAVVADKSGAIVWSERQTASDEAFKKANAREPMTMAMLLVERLGPQLGLNADTAKAAKPGKYGRLMEERSGLPPQAERDALAARQKVLIAAAPTSTLLVQPVVAADQTENEIDARIAKAVADAKLFKSGVVPAQPVALSLPPPNPNEMKMLWDLARSLRAQVKKNPPAADYVLAIDYRFNPNNWERGFLHFVICDRQGEWVFVELQNSHHPDYQAIKPVSAEDGEKLLLKRLEFFLRPHAPANGI